jgi:hypothetical protein
MRTQLFCTVALAACIPAAVFAQRTRGGDPSGVTSGAMTPPPSAPKAPSARDLQDLNPASLLIDKKKKASLPDSTVAQLKAVEKKINDRNAQFFATYDSVHKWTKPLASGGTAAVRPGFQPDNSNAGTTSSAGDQAQVQSAMRELRKMMADFRDRHAADMTDALAIIPDAQKKAATDLLNSQNGDLDKLIGKP